MMKWAHGQRDLLVLGALLLLHAGTTSLPAQTLETETARLLPRGAWKFGATVESQFSEGTSEHAIPLLIEYGLTNRIELTVEPLPLAAIIPERGQRITGAGDLEATVTALMRRETNMLPAFALAAEAKVPTAGSKRIGTGKADYTMWGIASRHLGRFDTHANVAYTVVGSPAGTRLSNTWGAALATVYRTGSTSEWFAEVLGVTAASPESENGDGSADNVIAPEAAGAELVGTLGAGRYIAPGRMLFVSASYDNNAAVLLRLGVTIRP